MQKWEYCAIGSIGSGFSTLSHPHILNFTELGIEEIRINKPESNEVAKNIAKLGEQGWEMVGAGNTSEGHHCIYFKRPKE